VTSSAERQGSRTGGEAGGDGGNGNCGAKVWNGRKLLLMAAGVANKGALCKESEESGDDGGLTKTSARIHSVLE